VIHPKPLRFGRAAHSRHFFLKVINHHSPHRFNQAALVLWFILLVHFCLSVFSKLSELQIGGLPMRAVVIDCKRYEGMNRGQLSGQ
jgi:hypothetical protein